MQPFFNSLRSDFYRVLNGTFPDDSHAPAKSTKHFRVMSITINITQELPLPEFFIGSGCGSETTAYVSMPEAAMDEHDGLVLWKHQIRRSRQLFDMKSIPESLGEKNGAKTSLWPSVLSANARHHAAALRSSWDAHVPIIPSLQKAPFHTCVSQTDQIQAIGEAHVWSLACG